MAPRIRKSETKSPRHPSPSEGTTEKETFGEHELGVTPRSLDVRFQRSPGSGEGRGISGLEWKASDPAVPFSGIRASAGP